MKQQTGRQESTAADAFPAYLQSYDALAQHFRAELKGLSSTEKGDRFANFVRKAIPQTDIGLTFEPPVLSKKKSYDEGVDLVAQGKDHQSVLYIQSRLLVDEAKDIDEVVSAFQAYLAARQRETSVGQFRLPIDDDKTHRFMLVTLSNIANIRNQYQRREFASKDFYRQLIAEERLDFIDGHQLLQVVQAAYRKTNEVPTTIVVNLDGPPIRKGNVSIGIISSMELRRLHQEFGDALFFENVRDFLRLSDERPGRTTPNQEIVRTVKESPDKLLERNNGIVFKAGAVEIGESKQQLILRNGSVVNGCQTTMCLVDHAQQPSHVLVKIVETGDSWDVAKAANYQNRIDVIELELARYLRPQVVKRAAALSSVKVHEGGSAFEIIDDIFQRKVAIDETRLLFIGIFSRSPNNVFSTNYTDLRTDVISKFYEDDPRAENTFDTLFALQAASQKGIEEARRTYINPAYASSFDRLYGKGNLSYKCLISILALCGAVNMDISQRETDVIEEYGRMERFLSKSRFVLENLEGEFLQCYKYAVKLWMHEVRRGGQDESQIRQYMARRSQELSFSTVFIDLCIDIDGDASLHDVLRQGPLSEIGGTKQR